ncbi:MAG: CCA tRNA nucleotidyltransferase [Planctomycetes bacterium]|nr:CCA tRNA nucleotidyltransferase [Planctomycetota bacterium]
MQSLPPELARAVRSVAATLRSAGQRAWLVGGAVRDLALGAQPVDADLASAARPEELERLFPETHAVGRAFGTVVVHCAGLDVQVTTFRAESGYDDARRPTHVSFSASLEEDAARRDFTCNALYLDPLNDELADPTGGLADLAARRLRCVGDPATRFAEDGLRLLRLARLAAQHGLELDARTWHGARGALDALRGVSPERVLAELVRIAEGAQPVRAVTLLFELGVLGVLPGLNSLCEVPRPLAERCAALTRLGSCAAASFFATLFQPVPGAQHDSFTKALLELRPPRALHQRVVRIWELEPSVDACLAEIALGAERRARWIRLVRAEEFADALAVWSAWHPCEHEREREDLGKRAIELAHDELWPTPLVTSAELARAGVPRGPRWSELLRAAEDAQLDGELHTLEEARAWLDVEARR